MASSAFAQDSTAEELRSDSDVIVVTAQKRNESVQEVPLAISAYTGDALSNKGVTRGEDLQRLVPGLTFGVTNVATSKASIRGIGSENPELGGDPGVPVYLDGHYLQATSFLFRDFLDVERVEVLRGPQGTLYGRNAIGGTVNVISRRPTNDLDAYVEVDRGNYDKFAVQGALSGPITEGLRGRIALAREVRDGFTKNVNNLSEDYQDVDSVNVRASFEADLGDNIEAYFGGYTYQDDGNISIAPRSNHLGLDPRRLHFDTPNPYSRDKSRGAWLDVTASLGAVQLRSLSSYNKSTLFGRLDYDGSDEGEDNPLENGSIYRTFSQELQLLSDNDSRLKWIVGLFFYDEHSRLDIELPAASFFFSQNAKLHGQSFAGFAQADLELNDALSVFFGARYTRDEKSIDRAQGLFVPYPGLPAGEHFPDGEYTIFDITTHDSEGWEKASFRGGASYALGDEVNLYASISSGYKAGGFNAASPGAPAYEPETVTAYEAGIKSAILGGGLQLNLAGFYYDYSDKQEFQSVIVGTTPAGDPITLSTITNAASAKVYGVEVEMRAKLSRALKIEGSLSGLHATYGSFDSVDDFAPDPADVGVLQDLSGNRLSRSPKWKGDIAAEYWFELPGSAGSLTLRANYSWSDGYFTRPFNTAIDRVHSYDTVNASLRWESANDLQSVELYVRNAENDDIITSIDVVAADSSIVRFLSPRQYGVRLKHRF